MKSQKVLHWKQMPSRVPVTATMAWYLTLDHFHAPNWLWGAMGLFFAFVWTAGVIAMLKQDLTEISELK